ncbi:serine hydrolase [Nocardioides sp. WS12]|uniref:serine hydrolase domain-containing protein n=1 Tax=Nocardioides sp. WS12 TaxID=2486272 RepID=UPI0015F84792|nr:serine hydrolase [Nocardioides sp. WS12]
MNLRRTAAALALAAAALPLTVGNAPAAHAEDAVFTNTQASVAEMRASVATQMQNKAFGWQLAISQNGTLKVADEGGFAVSAADNNGVPIPMQASMQMELASVTKNVTAVATMKLLRRNGLTPETLVWPYLPKTWDTTKFTQVRFRHLLTHTSGINQALAALANPPSNNGWNAMKTVVELGTVVDSQRQYKNANFALLRIINAELWNRSGGKKYTNAAEEITITAANHTSYVLEFMREFIFKPAQIGGIGCITPGTTTGVRSYPLNATQASNGSVRGTGSEECAGARGLAMSSTQLVQYLSKLRSGAIIPQADLAWMDLWRAGWNEDSNGGDGGQSGPADGEIDNWRSPGAFWHGGDLLGTNQLHTCAMTFADGTQATLLINSDFNGNTQCGVLLKAWYDAKP